MNDKIFQRHEIKYLVTDSQKEQILREISGMMVPDPHGRSMICNIYFDTPDYRLIRRSLEKPAYKEKFRIRSYGRCGENDQVFMELKKKYRGVVYKRRISLTERECMDYLKGTAPLPEGSQIGREIDYFRSFYKGLAPRVHLSYEREAFYAAGDDSFRVTFDQNIRYRETELSLTAEPGGRLILPGGCSLMEIKTSNAIPLWFTDIITKHRLSKASYSKYGTAFGIILQEKLERDGYFVKAAPQTVRNTQTRSLERGKQNDRHYIFGNNDNRKLVAFDIFDKHAFSPDPGRSDRCGLRI